MTKSKTLIRNKHRELAEEIRKHDQLYYGDSAPIISDADYDALCEEMQSLERHNPWLSKENSPIHTVAHAHTHFAKVTHDTPLLSLDKAHNTKDLTLFLRRVRKTIETQEVSFVVQPKIDGLAIALKYKNGVLKKGKTRGDGTVGEDITQNVACVSGIPQTLPAPITCEVRGEVYITKEDFLMLNKDQEARGLPLFVNPRNAASGSLRQLDTRITQQRPLCFSAYSVYNHHFDTEADSLLWLKTMGFSPTEHTTASSLDRMTKDYEHIASHRGNYPMDIDGVVFKVNKRAFHSLLGTTAHHPRWAIAYKFPPNEGVTELKNVTFQVGKSGAITPVAILEPVTIGGVTITRASLHNFSCIKEKNLCISSIINVKRAGDVIPYVDRVIRQGPQARPIIPPTQCPSCKGSMEKSSEQDKGIFCTNTDCPAQQHQKLVHFCSKSGLNIQSLGPKQIAVLQRLKMLTNYEDIVTFPHKTHLHAILQEQPGWGAQSVLVLNSSIQQSLHAKAEKVFAALSIPYVGKVSAQILERVCPTLKSLAALAHSSDLVPKLQRSGLGESVARKIALYLSNKTNVQTLHALHPHIYYKAPSLNTHVTFTFTGTLATISRAQAITLLEKSCFFYAASLSKKTSFLVCGEKSGSKRKKADNIGIPCISEEEFLEKIKLVNPHKIS